MKGTLKERILGVAADLAIDFVVYDRRDDEDLSQEDLINAIITKLVSVDEIVESFISQLYEELEA